MKGAAAAVVVVFLLKGLLCTGYDVQRTTELGAVGGLKIEVLGTTVEAYRGIPFAEPPIRELRFKPPLPAKAWEGTLNATTLRSVCPQPLDIEPVTDKIEYGEDCLHLNVWVRGGSFGAPVLVWIFGGGFIHGSASVEKYSGAVIAAKTGIVVASMNYRVGVLGFLNAGSPESPGNMGLLDQNLALKWIKNNIQHFGGDPSRMTLFGESSGGMSVHAHVLSPMSRGLFWRAIAMSGVINAPDFTETINESVATGDALAAIVGCHPGNKTLASHPDEVIRCLRTRSADELVNASFVAAPGKHIPFLPTYHDAFLPIKPSVALRTGDFDAGIDLLTGVTSDEASNMLVWKQPKPEILAEQLDNLDRETLKNALYEAVTLWVSDVPPHLLEDDVALSNAAMRRKVIDYLSNRVFVCPMHSAAAAHALHGGTAYTYVFDHWPAKMPRPSWAGVSHAADVPFTFGLPLLEQNRANHTDEDVAMSERLLTMIGTFAGLPADQGIFAWPTYSARTPTSMLLKSNTTTNINGFHSIQCAYLARHL